METIGGYKPDAVWLMLREILPRTTLFNCAECDFLVDGELL